MKTHRSTQLAIPLLLSALLMSCVRMSESINADHVGLNGGFEEVADGRPVNWSFYTSATVPDADATILTDTVSPFEGTTAVRFHVISCSDKGGRFSPGMFTEVPAEPGRRYRVHCAVRNIGSRFSIAAGGVTVKTGSIAMLIQTDEELPMWKEYSFNVDVPEDSHRLRLEFSVLRPGRVWVDDVRIEME